MQALMSIFYKVSGGCIELAKVLHSDYKCVQAKPTCDTGGRVFGMRLNIVKPITLKG